MMCSLGKHQEGDDVRPPRRRRHLDNSATDTLAETDARTLADRRQRLHKDLRQVVGIARPETKYADDVDWDEFEPVPPDQQQLPVGMPQDDGSKQSRRQQRSRNFFARGEIE